MSFKPLFFIVVSLACFFPAGWRFFFQGFTQPAGLVSDMIVGVLFVILSWQASRLWRTLILGFWFLFQVMSRELLASVQRMPSWQDLIFAVDPEFLKNSATGFYFAHPGFAIGLGILSIAGILVPLNRPGKNVLIFLLGAGLLLLPVHGIMTRVSAGRQIAAIYNPLHWFIKDAFKTAPGPDKESFRFEDLPLNLRSADITGSPFFVRGQAKNVLFVVLEGVSGLYIPEIRQEMQVSQEEFQMERLAAATADAMLVPDFIVHSHQTIRGLYAMHCGDFSKFSYTLPKALELQFNPERASQCLPAQLAANGWETHYLQGASLQFMNKDRAMPTMGFQQVHGLEWFSQRTRTDFDWGTTDADFFTGASQYIRNLKASGKPWFLSLLTVATHQPFDATKEMTARYGSRKIASIALLDLAVGRFIDDLRQTHVLDDTLVIITSDESHGAEGADWYSAWGFAAVLAPEHKTLPRLKKGTYGLVDLEVSVLDYLGLPLPRDIIGRSIFREYQKSRDMVSYTAGKLHWQTKENILYECIRDQGCRVTQDARILGSRPAGTPADEGTGQRLFAMAAALDRNLVKTGPRMVLQFANGETRTLPEEIKSEWIDNLIGAQYLSFPENSHVRVDIQLTVIMAEPEGIQPVLTLRQFENKIESIAYPLFPRLKQGDAYQLQFDFKNPKARDAFSFHLTAAGHHATLRLDKFEIVIESNK